MLSDHVSAPDIEVTGLRTSHLGMCDEIRACRCGTHMWTASAVVEMIERVEQRVGITPNQAACRFEDVVNANALPCKANEPGTTNVASARPFKGERQALATVCSDLAVDARFEFDGATIEQAVWPVSATERQRLRPTLSERRNP